MDTLEMLAEYYQDLLNSSGGKARIELIEINMRVLVGRYYHRVAEKEVGKVFFCPGYTAPHFWCQPPDSENYKEECFINRCAQHPERRAEPPTNDHYQRAKTAI